MNLLAAIAEPNQLRRNLRSKYWPKFGTSTVDTRLDGFNPGLLSDVSGLDTI
jgi:hypothetical protein